MAALWCHRFVTNICSALFYVHSVCWIWNRCLLSNGAEWALVIISAVANDNSQKTSCCAEKAIDYSFENSFKTLLPSGCAKITDHSTQRAAWLLTKQWINQSVRHSNRDVCYAKHCPQKQMIWKNLRAGRSTSWNIHCVHPRLPWDVLIRHVRHSTCAAASSPKLNCTEFYCQLHIICIVWLIQNHIVPWW